MSTAKVEWDRDMMEENQMPTMDEYVEAAMERINHWEGAAGSVNVKLAIKVELETMFKAGANDTLRKIREAWVNYSVTWMPVWLETVFNEIGYQAEDMGTSWNRSK